MTVRFKSWWLMSAQAIPGGAAYRNHTQRGRAAGHLHRWRGERWNLCFQGDGRQHRAPVPAGVWGPAVGGTDVEKLVHDIESIADDGIILVKKKSKRLIFAVIPYTLCDSCKLIFCTPIISMSFMT